MKRSLCVDDAVRTSGLLVYAPNDRENVVLPRMVRRTKWSEQSPMYMEYVLVETVEHELKFKVVEDHAAAPAAYFPKWWVEKQPYPGHSAVPGFDPVGESVLKAGLIGMGFSFDEPFNIFDAALSLLQIWNAKVGPVRKTLLGTGLSEGGGLHVPGLSSIIDAYLLPPAHHDEFHYMQLRIRELLLHHNQQPQPISCTKRRKTSNSESDDSGDSTSDQSDVDEH